MNGKIGRLEAERMLLIALLAQQLERLVQKSGGIDPAHFLAHLRELPSEFSAAELENLEPYLAAMRVDVANAELKATFAERLRSAADVLERILRHRIEAARPEDPSS